MTAGQYEVPGLGERKRLLTAAGGDSFDMAVAMMETESMRSSPEGYPFGDVYPNKIPKTGDAANFGIFKQNWFMIRHAWRPFKSFGDSQWQTGIALNKDLKLDVNILHASRAFYGDDWFIGQRQGAIALCILGMKPPSECHPECPPNASKFECESIQADIKRVNSLIAEMQANIAPVRADIDHYRNVIYWTRSQIESGHATDDWRFSVNSLPPK